MIGRIVLYVVIAALGIFVLAASFALEHGGGYTSTEDGTLQIGPLRSTMMAGEPDAMTLEQEYLTALSQTFGYTLAGDTLTLYGAADQVLTFTAAS